MKVLALVPSLTDTAPGQRFRVEQWARHLETRGFAFDFVPFEDEALHRVLYAPGMIARKAQLVLAAMRRRFALARAANGYDVALIYREATMVGPAVVERWLRRRGIPLVYDFDDPIWLPYTSPSNGALARLKFPNKTASICRLASVVTVGNRLLAEYASRHSANVHVVPTTIELDRYPARTVYDEPSRVTLGWTGSHSTLAFLEQLRDPLRVLAERDPYRLVIISHSADYRLQGVDVDTLAVRWSADAEATDLAQMDIGLAPFPDTGWTPWRCHGKVLQYMALGIPVVASPVGVVSDYIADGETGFLARTECEWVEKLSRLIRDRDLRARIGAAGRRVVEQRFSASGWADAFGEILVGAAATGRTEHVRN